MKIKEEKPKPFLREAYCKGCERCIEACPTQCFEPGDHIHPLTGLTPISLHLDKCNGCGLCMAACPEPYGIHALKTSLGEKLPELAEELSPLEMPFENPSTYIPLPPSEPIMVKGTYASAIGALLAGCRHFFGYPITPSTEGAELMAKILPHLDGIFVQAVSEIATVNMMYGCGGAGKPCMTFTSSPGFSLMLEGISYMIGAEIPGVFVNIMRGGPGLGNIGPEQADIKLAVQGLGHGNTQAVVLAPSTPQEMLDLTMDAFEISIAYRNPVVILGDGYLGQITGKVHLPKKMIQPGIPSWAVYGDQAHRRNLNCSIYINELDLEKHNERLNAKYRHMMKREQRCEQYHCEDAEYLILACNTPARMAKGAVRELRQMGHKIGLFRPISLWPFPIRELKTIVPRLRKIMVVEASNGQLENEMRLALSHAAIATPEIGHLRHFGGILPSKHEIVEAILAEEEVFA